MDLKFRVQAKIQKSVSEVFGAVYDPKKLSSYFTTGGASGPLKEGMTVTWNFADDTGHLGPGGFPVEVKKVIQNKLIILEWRAEKDDYNTRVRDEVRVART